MQELQRITTTYVDAEDRLRLTGELNSGVTLEVWLSQRLLLRLIPHLTLWLEQRGTTAFPTEIEQALEQHAASKNLSAEAPVQHTGEGSSWLAQAVDMNAGDHAMRLAFRRDGETPVTLTLTVQALRQWLSILRMLWVQAEWPADVWPEWLTSSQQALPDSTHRVH